MLAILLPILQRLSAPLLFIGSGFVVGSYIAYSITASHYDAEIAQERDARQRAVIDAQNIQMQRERDAARITSEVANDYSKKISDLDSRYNDALERLRESQLGKSASGLPAVPAAKRGRMDGAPGRNGFPRCVTADTLAKLRQADEQAQMLLSCRAWVSQQGAL